MEGVPTKILGRARSRLLTYSAPGRATLKRERGAMIVVVVEVVVVIMMMMLLMVVVVEVMNSIDGDGDEDVVIMMMLILLFQGHAAPILYAAWAEAGLFPVSELAKLRSIDSDLEGHPTPVSTLPLLII